jgi:hypothetical protein
MMFIIIRVIVVFIVFLREVENLLIYIHSSTSTLLMWEKGNIIIIMNLVFLRI